MFFFIFKHGLNHPEMQRNFFSPLGDPPSSFLPHIDFIFLNEGLIKGILLKLGIGTSTFGGTPRIRAQGVVVIECWVPAVLQLEYEYE